MEESTAAQHQETIAYRINPLCKRLGIGRSTLYKLVSNGKIRAVRIGGRRLIPASEVERLLTAGT